jgi:acetyl esterase/lipase
VEGDRQANALQRQRKMVLAFWTSNSSRFDDILHFILSEYCFLQHHDGRLLLLNCVKLPKGGCLVIGSCCLEQQPPFDKMILGPVSLLDCVVFVIFLIPQLLYQAGPLSTLLMVCKVLPFLSKSPREPSSDQRSTHSGTAVRLPFQFIRERYFLSADKRSPFAQNATVFQDIVIRCVRYAFAYIPASIGRVFFSRWVAYPFLRFRLLRHGFLRSPIFFQEVVRRDVRGLWIIPDKTSEPDIIIYYCHGKVPRRLMCPCSLLTGGGFSMGSSYFYLEFLMAWVTRLQDKGYKNPACFALEYTLVPDAKWPTQFNETRAGYTFLRESFGDGSAAKICVSGDSAGGTLILSMLLQPGALGQEPQFAALERPGLAVLLSPWTHLVSDLNQNTPSDYLDRNSLHLYARQYAGTGAQNDEVMSPGLSISRWKHASPTEGYRIIYGSEEVFAPGIQDTIDSIRKDGAVVKAQKLDAGIHAWPVVNLFLGETREERLQGLDLMVECLLSSNMAPHV